MFRVENKCTDKDRKRKTFPIELYLHLIVGLNESHVRHVHAYVPKLFTTLDKEMGEAP